MIQQRRSSIIWARHWTPRLLQDEVERAWLVDREGMSEECPPLGADELADKLGVRKVEREALGLKTIGVAMLASYTGGIIPDPLRRALTEARRARSVSQERAAQEIEVSRPQPANSLQGRFGPSPEVAALFKAWIGTGWQAPPWFASRAA